VPIPNVSISKANHKSEGKTMDSGRSLTFDRLISFINPRLSTSAGSTE